jgi:hypothetical protein
MADPLTEDRPLADSELAAVTSEAAGFVSPFRPAPL